ncbi:MAG: glycine cleavage system protein T [Rhodospirillaceae bacterium]|nr:glycine cleavage system protein T [Rhodospirillaceae bacterium]|tara:strand:+ start:209 stop:1312 length:1104 start_codon:yes stop_codon:yes gene_type:complete
MGQSELKSTPLDRQHRDSGGKMVEFAGYSMPVHYRLGVKAEHLHTRSKVGLFDVSHMGQVRLRGDSADEQLEKLVPGDIQSLRIGKMRYTVFTNEKGGVLDDLIVTKADDHLYVVVNAATKIDDICLMEEALDCEIEILEDFALLALQGPHSEIALEKLVPGVKNLGFMEAAQFSLFGTVGMISRSGYTGEDGFEISITVNKVNEFAEKLLSQAEVEFIGLGARDSLRLEAGLCLYGQDLTTKITPVEAGLEWIINKRRRKDGGFPGYDIISRQLETGVKYRRVGILPEGRAPARGGTKLISHDGDKIGEITSGGFGPTLGRPIAMGFIDRRFSDIGSSVLLLIRGNLHPAQITKLPFVHPNYKRQK